MNSTKPSNTWGHLVNNLFTLKQKALEHFSPGHAENLSVGAPLIVSLLQKYLVAWLWPAESLVDIGQRSFMLIDQL